MTKSRILRPLALLPALASLLLAPTPARAGVVCQVGMLGEITACCTDGCGQFGLGCASGTGNYQVPSGTPLGSYCPAESDFVVEGPNDGTVNDVAGPGTIGPGAVATFVRDEIVFELGLRRVYASEAEAQAIDDVAKILTEGEDAAASKLERGDVSGAMGSMKAAVQRLQAVSGSSEADGGAHLEEVVHRISDAALLGTRAELDRRASTGEDPAAVEDGLIYLEEAGYAIDAEADAVTAMELLEEATATDTKALEPAA